MAIVHIPAQLRKLTGGELVDIEAANLRQLLEELETRFPGIQDRLCEGDRIRPGLQVTIDGEMSQKGLTAPLAPQSEVYFLPAIGGG